MKYTFSFLLSVKKILNILNQMDLIDEVALDKIFKTIQISLNKGNDCNTRRMVNMFSHDYYQHLNFPLVSNRDGYVHYGIFQLPFSSTHKFRGKQIFSLIYMIDFHEVFFEKIISNIN